LAPSVLAAAKSAPRRSILPRLLSDSHHHHGSESTLPDALYAGFTGTTSCLVFSSRTPLSIKCRCRPNLWCLTLTLDLCTYLPCSTPSISLPSAMSTPRPQALRANTCSMFRCTRRVLSSNFEINAHTFVFVNPTAESQTPSSQHTGVKGLAPTRTCAPMDVR
jgi:hypothetical protein